MLTNSYSQIEITRNITIDDGLAYSQVTFAFKDSRGIMWFGTTAGLSEWNSVKFKNYYKLDGLPSTFVASICEDKTGEIYVATRKGLVVKKENKFIAPPSLPVELQSQINDLFVSSNGKFYILTESYGIWVKDENGFSQIENQNIGEQIIPISITERKSGKILVGTKRSGIYEIFGDKLKRYIYHEIYKKYPVADIIELNNDTLYIALQGLGVLIKTEFGTQKKGNTFITTKHGLTSRYVNNFSLDSNGKLYVATLNGISIIKGGKVKKTLTTSSGLDNEFVIKTYILDNETVMILTEGSGIFIYHPESFVTYNTNSGLLHDNVWAVKELQNGSICFLTDEGISFLKNNKFSSITTKNGLGDNLVISLYELKNNNLYVGTYVDGVNLISKNKITRLNNSIGMPENSVWSIQEDNNGNMLFVTHLEGIAVYDEKKIIDTLGIKDGLPNNSIVSSFKKKDGTILIGVENEGIYKLENNKFLPYSNKLKNCLIWTMHEDEKGTLYFGTNEHGLIRCRVDKKCDTISVKNGLSNNSIIGIEHDNMGNIYAATDRGLNIIRFLKDGSYQIKQIYKKSGLANSECNQSAIYKDSKGNIWVGTISGATCINPKKINDSENLIPVYISKLKVMDKEVELIDSSKSNIFEYNKNDITFEFAGINYSNSGIINYKYKLSNIDKSWIFDKSNEVRYANLPSGNYRFSVSASNDWGMWAEPTEIFFRIKKPFWETWWFILTMLLIIILIVYSIINYRLQNIIKLEKLRSKISADLHDEIGSGLSEISILSELLKFNLKSETELEKGLERIGSSTRSLIDKLSDIIWIVNPQKESLKGMILRIQDNYQELLYHSDISLNIVNLDLLENVVLPLEVRQNLYLLSKEAINNSLKYSGCTNVDFEVKKRDKKFWIEIRDDGEGFDVETVKRGNGLFNMKKRAANIEAKIVIDSSKGRGTTIRVEVEFKKLRKKND